MNVLKYGPDNRCEWNEFVTNSKNSHFMFHRDYMEYHADRFNDFSLIVRSEKDEIIGVMPANLSRNIVYSHQGLSFGGLCLGSKATTSLVLEAFEAIVFFLKSNPLVDELIYKRMPDFYTTYPAQEDLYSLFRLSAQLYRRDVSVAVDLNRPLPFSKMRKRLVKKAQKNHVDFFEETCLSAFWELLRETLQFQHGVEPVHSLKEIETLRSKFPKNIRCFTARKDCDVIAGVLIFETSDVVHTQYLANGVVGRELGGLDLVVSGLMEKYSGTKKILDFGISTEQGGVVLNAGLISQKEGFGARALVHDFYRLTTR